MQSEEVKSRTIKSTLALFWRTMFLQTVSFATFFVLGVYLSPSAIGIFVAISALLRVFTLFTDIGLGAALIQKEEDLEASDLSTAFTLQIFLVSLIVFLGFLTTPLIKHFALLDSSGIGLYWALLVTLLISAFKTIPSIQLERKLAFEKQVIPQIVESLAFNFILLISAYRGLGVDSYTLAVLASSLIGLPIYYLISPWRVAFGVDWARAKKMISFGIIYQGKSILAVIKDDLLTFVVTGFVGTLGIGYWGWAQRWAYSPYRLVVDSITKVTFPAYARIQKDRETLKSGLEKSIFSISVVLFPVFALISINIQKFLFLFPKYAKWEPALVSFYFLCAGAAISSLSGVLINVLDATGHVKTTLKLMVLWIVVGWVTTLVFVKYFGFTGISISSFVTSLTIVLTVILVKRVVDIRFWSIIWRPFLATLVMTVATVVFFRWHSPNLGLMIISLFASAIIYLTAIFLLCGKEARDVFNQVFLAYKHKYA